MAAAYKHRHDLEFEPRLKQPLELPSSIQNTVFPEIYHGPMNPSRLRCAPRENQREVQLQLIPKRTPSLHRVTERSSFRKITKD